MRYMSARFLVIAVLHGYASAVIGRHGLCGTVIKNNGICSVRFRGNSPPRFALYRNLERRHLICSVVGFRGNQPPRFAWYSNQKSMYFSRLCLRGDHTDHKHHKDHTGHTDHPPEACVFFVAREIVSYANFNVKAELFHKNRDFGKTRFSHLRHACQRTGIVKIVKCIRQITI